MNRSIFGLLLTPDFPEKASDNSSSRSCEQRFPMKAASLPPWWRFTHSQFMPTDL